MVRMSLYGEDEFVVLSQNKNVVDYTFVPFQSGSSCRWDSRPQFTHELAMNTKTVIQEKQPGMFCCCPGDADCGV